MKDVIFRAPTGFLFGMELASYEYSSEEACRGDAFLKLYHKRRHLFHRAVFDHMSLSTESLENVDFSGSKFLCVAFKGIRFKNCNFSGTSWENCDFIDSTFIDCGFERCIFDECDFSLCNFSKAKNFDLMSLEVSVELPKNDEMGRDNVVFDGNFSRASFKKCVFSGSSFLYSNFHGSQFWNLNQMSEEVNEIRRQRIRKYNEENEKELANLLVKRELLAEENKENIVDITLLSADKTLEDKTLEDRILELANKFGIEQ